MKRIILVALMAVAGAAFASGPKPAPSADDALQAADQKMKTAAMDLIRYNLKDPESARFRTVFISPKGKAVCGEVNAKNAMGGYAGFKRFIAARDRLGVEDDGSAFVEANWVARCRDDVNYDDPQL